MRWVGFRVVVVAGVFGVLGDEFLPGTVSYHFVDGIIHSFTFVGPLGQTHTVAFSGKGGSRPLLACPCLPLVAARPARVMSSW